MKRILAVVTASMVLLAAGAAAGAAAAKLHVLSLVCVATKSRAVTAPVKGKCHAGSLLERVGTTQVGKTGATGPAGPAGATGPQGAQGPAGTPASAKSFVVNWKQGGTAAVNASPGVSLSSGPFEDLPTHSELTVWHFPIDVSSCALEVSVGGQSGFTYAFLGGGASGPSGPLAQVVHKSSDPASVSVFTEYPATTGTDFSLLVACA